jgi:hypothetical protein
MLIDGTLQIDEERGVIYFHDELGGTVLRICRLPRPIPLDAEEPGNLLDITHMHGASWDGDASAVSILNSITDEQIQVEKKESAKECAETGGGKY